MTPKEKAEELVGKFKIPLILSDTDAGEEIICTTISKKCALIAFDEIFFALKYNLDGATSGSVKYWNQVKIEIEKL
jgi:hypothetical protein